MGDLNNETEDSGFNDFADFVADREDEVNDESNKDNNDPDEGDVKGGSEEPDVSDSTDADGDDDNGSDEAIEESVEDKKEDPNTKVIEELKAQNAKLLELLNNGINGKKPDKEIQPEPEETNVFEDEAFTQLTDVLDLDEGEKKIMIKFFDKFAEQAYNKAFREITKATPGLVRKTISEQTEQENLATNFYNEYPELSDVKGYVAELAKTIAKENPGSDTNTVLKATAERAYKNLGLKPGMKSNNAGEQNKSAEKKKPAFAKKSGTRKPAPNKSKLDSDIDAMLALDF